MTLRHTLHPRQQKSIIPAKSLIAQHPAVTEASLIGLPGATVHEHSLWTLGAKTAHSTRSCRVTRNTGDKLTSSIKHTALLENLTCSRLVKFPAFYGTGRFITPFIIACHLSLFSASSIESMPPHPNY